MKRFVIAGAAMLLMSCSFAADWAKAESSSAALSGAVTGLMGGEFNVRQITTYLPGYGLQLSFYSSLDMPVVEEALTTIPSLVVALAGTVQGLDSGDYVSLTASGRPGWTGTDYSLLVRMIPGQPETLTVWLDGVRQ